jgi:hypothetical protein
MTYILVKPFLWIETFIEIRILDTNQIENMLL